MVWKHNPEWMKTRLVFRNRVKQNALAVIHFLKMSLWMHAQGCMFYRNASILFLVQRQPRNIFHQLGRQNSPLTVINGKIFLKTELKLPKPMLLSQGIRNKLIMDLRLTFFFAMKGVSTFYSSEKQ